MCEVRYYAFKKEQAEQKNKRKLKCGHCGKFFNKIKDFLVFVKLVLMQIY